MNQTNRPFGRRLKPTAAVAPEGDRTVTPRRATWPLFFLAMIPAYLIHQIPVVNVIVVFILSPFWIGLLLNLGLMAMAADAWRGAAPRWLLVVPVAVYGLNLVASGMSYLDYRALDQRLAQENAATRLAFDPTRMSLVASAPLAGDLVQRYALPATYAAPERADPTALLRVLPQAVCETIPKSPDHDMRTTGVTLENGRADNACLLSLPAAPPLPVLTISETTSDPAEAVNLNRITLSAPDGRRVTLSHGWTKVLSPIPFPLVGCMTWIERKCEAAMFSLTPRVGAVDGYGARSVAVVLGLKPRLATKAHDERGRPVWRLDEAQTLRLAAGSEPAVAQARTFGARAVDHQLALLTQVIEGQDPGERPDSWILITNADRVDADALMTALERDLGDSGAHDRRELLREVAAALTPQAIDRIGPRLVRAVAADERLRESDSLMIRLGDVGEPAARLLSSMLDTESGRGARTYLTLGLCRAGTAGADAAQLVADKALADTDAESLQAATVAVLRMGRRDLAERLVQAPVGGGLNGPGQGRHRDWMKKTLAQVTPASPRGVCRTRDHNYSPPDVPWLRDAGKAR
jgi:hypothetical protein